VASHPSIHTTNISAAAPVTDIVPAAPVEGSVSYNQLAVAATFLGWCLNGDMMLNLITSRSSRLFSFGQERCFKPTAGKRKAADAPEAFDAAQPSHDAAGEDAMAMVPAEAAAEDLPAAAGPSTGPMTKAKKRKGA